MLLPHIKDMAVCYQAANYSILQFGSVAPSSLQRSNMQQFSVCIAITTNLRTKELSLAEGFGHKKCSDHLGGCSKGPTLRNKK